MPIPYATKPAYPETPFFNRVASRVCSTHVLEAVVVKINPPVDDRTLFSAPIEA
jgi:hypothetical protein